MAFFSKMFTPKMLNSSTYLKELHSITTAVKKWRRYLLGNIFIIQTDHNPLKELMSRSIQTPEQQVYLSKLPGFHYDIQYKPRSLNVVADALSRVGEDSVISVWLFQSLVILQQLREKLPLNGNFADLKAMILVGSPQYSDYRI